MIAQTNDQTFLFFCLILSNLNDDNNSSKNNNNNNNNNNKENKSNNNNRKIQEKYNMKKKSIRQGSNPLDHNQVSNLFLFLLFDPPQLLMTMQVINHQKSLNAIRFSICYSRQSAQKCIMKLYLWKQLVIIYPVSLEFDRQQEAMKIFFFIVVAYRKV